MGDLGAAVQCHPLREPLGSLQLCATDTLQFVCCPCLHSSDPSISVMDTAARGSGCPSLLVLRGTGQEGESLPQPLAALGALSLCSERTRGSAAIHGGQCDLLCLF